jgi:hypothetical protein
MKTRMGFVSNSSSSSFVVDKNLVTEKQLDQIRCHSEIGEEMGVEYTDWAWEIGETDEVIYGSTLMDNFDMEEFLGKIGVPSKAVKWDDYPINPENLKNIFDSFPSEFVKINVSEGEEKIVIDGGKLGVIEFPTNQMGQWLLQKLKLSAIKNTDTEYEICVNKIDGV